MPDREPEPRYGLSPGRSRLVYPEGPQPMLDAADAYRWTTEAAPASLGAARAPRGLTIPETEELTLLRRMMSSNAYMTGAQRRRWFELWQRHDR
jgi:hypothetical protein